MPFSPVDVNRTGACEWNCELAKYSTKSSNNPIDQGGLAGFLMELQPNFCAIVIIRTAKTSSNYD
jgi:hypothetical protein